MVTEELLAHGAPVAAHWIADRQVAPGLLAYGNEEQRQRLLPRIAAGRFFSAIGMSEHGAGIGLGRCANESHADRRRLATQRHQNMDQRRPSRPSGRGAGAHQPTRPRERHAGFSQFLVPCDAAGVTISPIELMSGEHHFNEVTFDDVFVPDADVLGEVGDGWHQVTAELSFERSGPERILSTVPLITAAIGALASGSQSDDHTAAALGELLARLISLRQLSVSVARALADPVNRRPTRRRWSRTSAPASSRSRSSWSPTCWSMRPHRPNRIHGCASC